MRSTRRLAPLALVSALTLASACNKEPAPQPGNTDDKPSEKTEDAPAPAPAPAPTPAVTPPSTDSQPVANADGIVATMQIPTGTAMTDLAAVVDNIKPGTSMLLKMQAPTMLGELMGMDLGGAKLDRPISLVIVDPISNPKPIALLVEVGDAGKLSAAAETSGVTMRERDGRALLGPAGVVEQAEAFAFTGLANTPDHSEIVIYPKTALAVLGPKLDEGMADIGAQMAGTPAGPAAAKMFTMYLDVLKTITAQTERVVISVGTSEASSDLFVRMYPTSGTTLAAFIAAQTPSDHPHIGQLPASDKPAVGVMSGNIVAGDARDAMIAWSIEFMQSMYQSQLSAEQWQTLLGTWLASFDGSFAVSIDMDPGKLAMNMSGVMGSTDSTTMRAAWREMMTAMTAAGGSTEMMGMKFAMSFTTDALEHDGVPVDLFRTSLDLSSMPPEQQAAMAATGAADQAMHLATFDQLAVMASANEDGAAVKQAIDAARGKGPSLQPSPTLTAVLGESKQHQESLIYYIDIAGFAPPEATAKGEIPFSAMVMGMGKYGDALSMRLSLRK